MLEDITSQRCSHNKANESKPCPYSCQSWINSFPWDKTNARFDKTDVFANFLKTVQNLSAGDLFDSIDLVYDAQLNSIVDAARSSVEDPNSDNTWKQRLVEEVKKLESLPTLNDKQFAAFQQLVNEKLLSNINVNKGKTIPSVLIMTPEEDEENLNIKMVFNALKRKKRILTTEDMVSMHETLPELKSVTIRDLHFKLDKYDVNVVKENCLESLDITLSNPVASPPNLLAYVFRSYHETIKSLKLEMSPPLAPREFKKGVDRSIHIDRLFKENKLNFSNLEHLEISNFSNSIDIGILLRKLRKTSCSLKRVKFLGQETLNDIFKSLTKSHHRALESLVLSSKKYEDIRLLSDLKALKELSYLWDNTEEKVDILKVLMVLPHLTSLELGYDKRQGALVSNVVNFDIYSFLNRISLSHVNIDEDLFEKLNPQLPNLKNVILTGCRIKKNRSDSETTISFGNYVLDTLVIDDCKLHNSSKLVNKARKGYITRFMLAMGSVEPYVATIRSSLKDESKNGKLYIERKFFVYDVAVGDNETLAHVTLSIKANLVRSFSVSRSSPVHVALCLENELESEDDFSENSTNEVEKTEDSEDIGETEDLDEDIDETEDVDEDVDEDIDETEDVDEDIDETEEIGEDTDETEEVEEFEDVEKGEDAKKVSDAEETKNTVIERIQKTEAIKVTDDNEENEEPTRQVEEEASNLDVNSASEVDEDSLPEVSASHVSIQKDSEDGDNSFYGSEAESGGEQDAMTDSTSDIVMNDVTLEDKDSTSESDDDEPVVVIVVKPNLPAKKINVSDEDYTSSGDIATPDSSESEFDDDMGSVRRSLRLIPRKPSERSTKTRMETRKRQRQLFSSSGEEEEDEKDNFSGLISQFVRNCKEYNAVIRIFSRKRSKLNSPAL